MLIYTRLWIAYLGYFNLLVPNDLLQDVAGGSQVLLDVLHGGTGPAVPADADSLTSRYVVDRLAILPLNQLHRVQHLVPGHRLNNGVLKEIESSDPHNAKTHTTKKKINHDNKKFFEQTFSVINRHGRKGSGGEILVREQQSSTDYCQYCRIRVL